MKVLVKQRYYANVPACNILSRVLCVMFVLKGTPAPLQRLCGVLPYILIIYRALFTWFRSWLLHFTRKRHLQPQ